MTSGRVRPPAARAKLARLCAVRHSRGAARTACRSAHPTRTHMRRHLSTAICLALAGFTMAPLGAASAAEARLVTTQLPRGVVPSHYDVAVTPHADKLTFDGQVTITLTVIKPTSSITLNAADLTFSKASLTPE